MSTLNINKNHQNQLPPQWTTFVPEGIYHAKAQAGRVVSSTMLKEFRRCPAHYHAIVTGRTTRRDKSVYRIGRAVHKLLLEGETAFRGSFFIGGPINERTGRSFSAASKTFLAWIEENSLDAGRVITGSEAGDIARMRDAVRRHGEAAALLGQGWPERCATAEYGGAQCQVRLDWLTPGGDVVDVKTTCDISHFEEEARRYDYLYQFAFYREVVLAAGAGDVSLAAVVIEKREPFRVGVWRFPASVLAPYAMRNHAALRVLARCRENGVWPTGYEEARTFPPADTPKAWLN